MKHYFVMPQAGESEGGTEARADCEEDRGNSTEVSKILPSNLPSPPFYCNPTLIIGNANFESMLLPLIG